jgi:hypothetical protein
VDVLDDMKELEAAGKLEDTRRTRVLLGQVFRYAITQFKTETDPMLILRGATRALCCFPSRQWRSSPTQSPRHVVRNTLCPIVGADQASAHRPWQDVDPGQVRQISDQGRCGFSTTTLRRWVAMLSPRPIIVDAVSGTARS